MPNLKLFVVRKYVAAKDAAEAVKKEKRTPVCDVWWEEADRGRWIDEKNNIGFAKKKK